MPMVGHRVAPRVWHGIAAVLVSLWIVASARGQELFVAGSPADCAIPVRYSFDRLRNDLKWAGVEVPLGALVDAHSSYTDTIDALAKESLPYVVQVRESVWSMPEAVRLTEAERVKLRARQKQMLSATTAAEDQLHAALAAAAPETSRAAVTSMRERRRLSALIEAMARQGAVMARQSYVPADAGASALAGLAQFKLSPELKASVLQAIDAAAPARTRAWTALGDPLQAAVAETLKAQAEQPATPPNSYMQPEIVQVDVKALADVAAVEMQLRRQIAEQVPSGMRGVVRGSYGGIATDLPACSEDRPALPGPSGMALHDVRNLSRLLVTLPQLDDATRKSVRELCATWVKQDEALADNAFDAGLAASTAQSTLYPSRDDNAPRRKSTDAPSDLPRAVLAREMMEKLTALTSLDWVKEGGTLPPDLRVPEEVPLIDQELFGMSPSKSPDQEVTASRQTSFWARWRSTQGMSPVPWHPEEVRDLVERLRLSDAQRIVAEQILADAQTQWTETVEPLSKPVLEATQATMGAGARDDEKSRTARIAVVEKQPQRRQAWAAADVVDAHIVKSLQQALGPTAPEGMTLLCVIDLGRQLDATLGGCMPLTWASAAYSSPNIVRVAMDLRGSAAEKASLVKAICAHGPDVTRAAAESRELALDLQDEFETLQRDLVVDRLRRNANREPGKPMIWGTPEERAAEAARFKQQNDHTAALLRKLKQLNDELCTALAQEIPDTIVTRLRARASIGSIQNLRSTDSQRAFAEATIARLPDGEALRETACVAMGPSLDAGDSWSLQVIDEIDRRMNMDAQPLDTSSSSPAIKRTQMAALVIRAAAQDRLAHAMARAALALPKESAQQVPMLWKYLN